MTPSPRSYRPDIDGLRAVAVGAVLLFHAGIPGFSGGYVGVDVFFVISGFLITSILWRECESGTISLLAFYERRVRRIMPALLLTLALTIAGGVYFMLPVDLMSLGKTILATLAFISNIKFWRGSGYFEGASEMQPLLHTWSLAIEEQFYLFWPVLLFLLHRYARKLLGAAVWAITLGSLALSAVAIYLSPSATFFLLPTRAWELSLGALVALGLFPNLSGKRQAAAETIGLALVLSPVFLYSKSTLFPGLSALPPCLGTAMLIQAGRDGTGPVGRLLATPKLVAIGLISYSLYLLHFPVLVYLRHHFLGELPILAGILGIALSVGLAVFSYRYVEQPFRDRQRISSSRIWIVTGMGNFAVAAAGVTLWFSGGLPNRFPAERLRLAAAANDIDGPSRACLNLPLKEIDTRSECAVGRNKGRATAYLWGDSHAAALTPALRTAFTRNGHSGRLVAFNACPPLLGFENEALSWADRKRCRERNRDFMKTMAARREPALIIINGYWSTYAGLMNESELVDLEGQIARNLDALRRHKVFILLDTPRTSHSLPWLLAYGRQAPKIDASTNDVVSLALRKAAVGRAEIIDPTPALCPTVPCSPLIDGRPMLSDNNHLAASVAKSKIGPLLAEVLPTSAQSAPIAAK